MKNTKQSAILASRVAELLKEKQQLKVALAAAKGEIVFLYANAKPGIELTPTLMNQINEAIKL